MVEPLERAGSGSGSPVSASCSAVSRERSEESRRSARACALSRYAAATSASVCAASMRRGVERPGRVAVQVERAELFVAVAQREREHRVPARLSSARGANFGNRDSVSRSDTATASPVLVRLQARALRRARSATPRSAAPTRPTPPRSADCVPGEMSVTPGGRDRQHVDDALDQVIEDRLDREVRHQRARELAAAPRRAADHLAHDTAHQPDLTAGTGRDTHLRRSAESTI